MNILGLKLTHDASFSIIKDNKLICCIEIEKLSNNCRHSDFILSRTGFEGLLSAYGYQLKDFDEIIIDGWYENIKTCLFTDTQTELVVIDYGSIHYAGSFPYRKFSAQPGLEYSSASHLETHLWSAYCTSPFAHRGESSFILVWDGGMLPHLLYFDHSTRQLTNFGVLFNIVGHIYSSFSNKFDPFQGYHGADLSIPGKVMAYIATGEIDHPLLTAFNSVYSQFGCDLEHIPLASLEKDTWALIFKLVLVAKFKRVPHRDVLHTFHHFIQEVLLTGLKNKLDQISAALCRNLCLSGGTALNIKWNNAIRNSNLFHHVWVPPFPNDSGSSIGAACAAMIRATDNYSLEWDVYSGPAIIVDHPAEGWKSSRCSLRELAYLIQSADEPIVFLNGNAELGPRALGNRSILAQATSAGMKDMLNRIKEREYYRPVAPICMEELSPEIFDPGTPDPYMLFEHIVRDTWVDKVPAICHLDRSSRLQTVNRKQNPVIYHLLYEYYLLTGIPLLCNTSANYPGKGFWPDLRSVMTWGGVKYIFSDSILYYNK